MRAEHQYLDLIDDVLMFGTPIKNTRTGVVCHTLVNRTLIYREGDFPLLTTRRINWRAAIAELIGYLRGYSNAADFRELGTNTWNANANENEEWLANPFRLGEDDMGRVYGVQGRRWATPQGGHIDQLDKIINHLSRGIDDRGEILTFYNVGELHMGCLRPCMHTYQFSLAADVLHLMVVQRSCDAPLGLAFNMVQAYAMLALMATMTGHAQGDVHHHIANLHVYDNQVDAMKRLLGRRPASIRPQLWVHGRVTGQDIDFIDKELTVDDFNVVGYKPADPIIVPFSV